MLSKLAVRHFSKQIHWGGNARAATLGGWDAVADAVQVTLGPRGRNVVIEEMYGPPKITKDGVTVAKAIDVEDKIKNCGVQLAKQIASRTNDAVGDGTTTATVLGRAMFREGCKAVAAGMNPMDIKRGMEHATQVVLDDLDKQAKKVITPEEIRQVATIASNSDKEIGDLLSAAYEKVGTDGTIHVKEGKTLEHELEVLDGCRFDKGYLSHYFISDYKTGKVEMKDPLVLFFEKKITSIQMLVPLLEKVMQLRRPLLIVAEDVEGEALHTLVVNRLRGGLDICAVKAPGFGANKKAQLQDLAIVCGGEMISHEAGQAMEEIELSQLGTAKQILVTKDATTIFEGGSSQTEIDLRIEQLKEGISTTESEYEKDKMKERIARLRGGVAVISVGGASEVEVNEVKDRLYDALCATKAAVEGGIVKGGGCALLDGSKKLEGLDLGNFDKNVGVNVVKQALRYPCSTIVKNGGGEGSVVVNKLLAETDPNIGYDAEGEQFVNMMEAGIIDPANVVKSALRDAASVAATLTTTEVVITDMPAASKLSPMDKRGMSYGQG